MQSIPLPTSRRRALAGSAVGFGWLAARNLLAGTVDHGLAVRARRVIFMFMKGGPSHVDTFDPKPKLTADDAPASILYHHLQWRPSKVKPDCSRE